MADIRAAAKALHDSRQLSEVERAEYWRHEVIDGDKHIITAGGVWVTDCGRGDVAGMTADHIACIAPPLVVAAVEQLLSKIPATLDFPATVDPWEIITEVWAAAEALAAAILREDR